MAYKVKDLMVSTLTAEKRAGREATPSPETTTELVELASTASAALAKLQRELEAYVRATQGSKPTKKARSQKTGSKKTGSENVK